MAAAKKFAPILTIEDIMVKEVIRVTPDKKISDVAKLMIKHLISGMPITDNMDRVISIIGEGDTLRLAAELGLETHLSHCLDRLPSTANLITLTKQDKFTDAYAIFLKHKIHRIPIVDSNGFLKGLVTRSTILQLFVEAQRQKA